MKRVVAVVQAGIAGWHYRRLLDNIDAYPPALDENPVNSPCLACFGAVMEKPLENNLWFKGSPTEYYFSRNGNTAKPEDYREKKDFKIVYDPALGSFTATRIE